MTETDLFPAVGGFGEAFSVRHNKDRDAYEIFDYEDEQPYTDAAVVYDGTLRDVIAEANRLEAAATGSSSFAYGHDPRLYCPVDW